MALDRMETAQSTMGRVLYITSQTTNDKLSYKRLVGDVIIRIGQ